MQEALFVCDVCKEKKRRGRFNKNITGVFIAELGERTYHALCDECGKKLRAFLDGKTDK